MTDLIGHMTSRFLQWKLPDDFAPDGGINFTSVSPHRPVGTNLFTYTQAKAMVIYMLDGAPIAALPAQGVRVRPLEWIDFEGRGAKAQAWNDANYMIQRWSDGRWEINASYPGYGTFLEGMDRFYPTLDAAKAAAQRDYESRILAALTTENPND